MNRLLSAIALILICACQTATAWPAHGTGVAPPPGPVLQNVAVTFGNRTISGYGEVRLNSQDINYNTGYTPKGLDVLVSGSCAKWSTSQTGGTAGHFNVISHVAEGASAVTPNPTAAGVTAQLNGGPYTFLVSCEDASNTVLSTATLTYNISTGTANNCGAVNLGPADNTGVAYFPSGFASTLDGCAVYLSTGYFRTTRFFLGMPFAHAVTYTCADGANRCGVLANLETGSNSTHVLMKDINISGPTNNGVGAAAFVLAGTDINADNIHAWSNSTIRSSGSYQCIKTNSSTGGTVMHFGCDWVSGFFTPSNNYTYQYGFARHANTDAIKTAGYTHDFHLKDISIITFSTPASPGIHPDSFQIGDGATDWDFSVERIMVVQAGGDIGNQGPMFGGGPSGQANDWKGYISDSTCSGAAGQTLCNTASGANSNGNGTKIYSTAGSPLGLGDGVTINCGGTPCPFGAGTKYSLTGLSGNVTLGSAASPVNIYGIPQNNATWDMIWDAGYVIQGTFPAGMNGTSAIRHFTHVFQTTPGQSSTGAPRLQISACDQPAVWTGSTTIEKGAEYNFWDTRSAFSSAQCSGNALPTSITMSNVLQASGNSTTLASWYTNGNPKTCLESKSRSQWDAMSVQAAMVFAASCTVVAPSGPLDLTTDVANAIGTDNVTPKWADGTVVGTGFNGY